jgi:hypothetical protein
MPALPRSLRTTVSRLASGALLALVAAACAAPSLDDSAVAPTEPRLAKAATASGVTVSSTRPSYADRGTTVDVHVIGTGFVAGAQATWLLHGVADPAKVRTNSTSYVSSTEVVANVTVSSDADLTFWDVQITAGGKNGVGTEVFEITTAQYLGPATFVYAMNEAGQVVGYNSGAFVYDPTFGMLALGAGEGWGVDPQSAVVVGRNGANIATAWMRQGTSASYVAQTLPQAPTAVGGNGTSAARDSLGTLLVGGWQIFPGAKRNTTSNRPALWRYAGTWSAPTLLPLPAGAVSGAVRDINGKGQSVGRIDSSDRGAVWDDPTTVTALDGIASGINPAGTLAVGIRGGLAVGQPAYWYRTETGDWNPVGVTLPTLGGSCVGEARGVNDAGVIVGKSCDSSNTSQATVWRLELTGPTPVLVAGPQRLPSLGKGSTIAEGSAAKVSSTAPYVIAGIAGTIDGGGAVIWRTW